MGICVECAERTFLDLIKDIVQGNSEALWEVHGRSIFEIANGRRVTLAEYVDNLREATHKEGWWRHAGTEVVDRAFDMLLDRFQNLPVEEPDCSVRAEKETDVPESRGPDCRNYFRAFSDYVAGTFERCPPATELEAEVRAARLLQRFVRWHFYPCIKESLREANPLMSRYTWKVNGYKFNLWFPKSIGHQRREWLEQHVPNPTELRPWDRSRIQYLIDKYFGSLRLLSLDVDDHVSHIPGPPILGTPRIDGGIAGTSSRELIAEEKAQTIDQQMPAIRVLGRERLKALVLAILENLVSGREADKALAKRFGLGPASFSRFAGRGGRGKKKRERLPALFINIAHYMSEIPYFVALAESEGVLDKAKRVIAMGGSPRTGEKNNES
jgi:hypothetical protein